jgi:Flp pilus assembly pilin Flp
MLLYAFVWVQNFVASLKREEGQGAAEYALILAVVAIVAVLALGTLGDEIDALMTRVSTLMSAPTP